MGGRLIDRLVFTGEAAQIHGCHPQDHTHSGLPCLWAVLPDDKYGVLISEGPAT